MAKRGPKPVIVDWDEFDKLAHMQCTLNEIAAWFDCCIDTIENRCWQEHGVKFSDYYRERREKGKISLRRAQYQLATQKHNPTMLIWLGKQYLGQTDKQEIDHNGEQNKFELSYSIGDILEKNPKD